MNTSEMKAEDAYESYSPDVMYNQADPDLGNFPTRVPGSRCVAEVKFFDNRKSFGFLNMDDHGEDIFVHSVDLTNNVKYLREGQRVQFLLLEENGKYKAKDVTNEDGTPLTIVHVCRTRPELSSRLEQHPELYLGTVKWFDPKRSYGFIVAEVGGHDVFFHARNVFADNPAALEPIKGGMEVEYTLMDEHINSKGDSESQLKAAKVTLPGGGGFKTHAHGQVALGMFEPYDRLRAVATSNPVDPTVRAGTVKWYSVQKKYGFLVTPSIPDQQVYVALHAIQPAGFDHLVEDQPVEFLVETRADGSLRAVGVTGPGSQLGPLYGGHAGGASHVSAEFGAAGLGGMYLGYQLPYPYPMHVSHPPGTYFVSGAPGQPPLAPQPMHMPPPQHGNSTGYRRTGHGARKRKGDTDQSKRGLPQYAPSAVSQTHLAQLQVQHTPPGYAMDPQMQQHLGYVHPHHPHQQHQQHHAVPSAAPMSGPGAMSAAMQTQGVMGTEMYYAAAAGYVPHAHAPPVALHPQQQQQQQPIHVAHHVAGQQSTPQPQPQPQPQQPQQQHQYQHQH